MPAQILVRYGELALKSAPVRREFEGMLRRNILDQFVRAGLTGRLRADHGHLYVDVDDGPAAIRVLRRVFGITSVSLVHEVPSDAAVIAARLVELADARLTPGASFAVRARRTGGAHPFTSQQLAGDLGGAVLERFGDRGLKVDLEHPDVELFVEVRGPRTYLSFDRVAGPGGLPLGVAGRLVALVDGPRGALGAYLMMKRGCRVGLIVLPAAEALARDVLGRFDPSVRISAAPADPPEWARALGRMSEELHAEGVVLPIGVDEYPEARSAWGERVLFSPTVGFTDEEVSDRWKNAVALTE
ncbi:MAG TPA: THUMP domain-containing protein [Thermoplasmata archaeon]|nr:THUMP domain-containing protein [Thermoplasmata archaeon]